MPPPAEAPDADARLTEAEEEAARADARAAQARARAARLRQEAERSSQRPKTPSATSFRRGLRLPSGKSIAVSVGVVLFSVSLAASGYMLWRDHAIMDRRQLATEFAAAARQGVTTLMSIDAQHARADLQRTIDSCTGPLKTQLEATSSVMAKQAEESKVVSKATVEAVAIESVTHNSAVALVAAKSDVTNADNTKRPPVLWRLSINLQRDGGRLKMSKVDFVQ
jgi:Mce-associated membrane protein